MDETKVARDINTLQQNLIMSRREISFIFSAWDILDIISTHSINISISIE